MGLMVLFAEYVSKPDLYDVPKARTIPFSMSCCHILPVFLPSLDNVLHYHVKLNNNDFIFILAVFFQANWLI